MKNEEIKKQFEKSGINLQLWAIRVLNENGWDCKLDELYTDDETKITREVDIVANKISNIPISLPTNKNLSKEECIIEKDFMLRDQINIKINLVIECKYIKDKEGWVFFSAKKNKSEKGLAWVLKKFTYPIFQRKSHFSVGTYYELGKKKNFREINSVLIAETAQEIKGKNKLSVRDGLLKTIKYLIYKMKAEKDFTLMLNFSALKNKYLKKLNRFLMSKILLLCPKRYFKWMLKIPKLVNLKYFTSINLNVYYPIVLLDGKIYYYDDISEKSEEKDHIIIKQSYLSKLFLKREDIDLIGREATDEKEILFNVEFMNKAGFEIFIKNIEEEAREIAQVAKESILRNFKELEKYIEIETKKGKKEAELYDFFVNYFFK